MTPNKMTGCACVPLQECQPLDPVHLVRPEVCFDPDGQLVALDVLQVHQLIDKLPVPGSPVDQVLAQLVPVGVPLLQGSQLDVSGEGFVGQAPDFVVRVGETSQHGDDEEDDVGNHLQFQLFGQAEHGFDGPLADVD